MRVNLFGTCMVVVLFTWSGAAGQQPSEPAQKGPASVTITIGDTAAPPEWHLSVPLAATVQPAAEVGRLSLLIVYPSKVLTFGKARPTDTLRKAGFDIIAGPTKVSGETGWLAVELKASRKDSDTLPSGTLGILEFKVDKDAPQKTWRMTAEEINAWSPQPDARKLTVAYTGPASVLVTPPGLPILSCFFYMH